MRHKRVASAIRYITDRIGAVADLAVDETAERGATRFKDTVASWKHRAKFIIKPQAIQNGASRLIVATGKEEDVRIFGYVDEGTAPHIIRPKKAGGRLVFQTGYSARTAYRAQYGKGSGKASGETVRALVVLHPGTEAREFTEAYAELAQTELAVQLEQAIKGI